jgi:type II secretory pathway pseudopilin PulG
MLRRGFTLIEVMLGGVLLLLLLLLLSQVLLPMVTGARRGTQQIELQQLAQVSVDRIVRDLSRTPLEGLSFVTGPPILAAQPLADVTGAGDQAWSDKLRLYWLDSSGQLHYRSWPPGPPNLVRGAPTVNVAFAPTLAELGQLIGGANATDRVLATHVQAFEVDLAAPAPTVRLVLAVQDQRFELTRSIRLRNQDF